jgi:SNF2 family DNA or RNA helicase
MTTYAVDTELTIYTAFPVLSGTPLQNDLQEYWSMVSRDGDVPILVA